MFDKDSVKLYQKVFLSRAQPSSDTAKPLLGFNETVDLLDELNFNHYGDGHYPLSHYLREIVGADIEVIAFTDFLQVGICFDLFLLYDFHYMCKLTLIYFYF